MASKVFFLLLTLSLDCIIPFCSFKYMLNHLAIIIKYSMMRYDIWRNGYPMYWLGCLLPSFREEQGNLTCDDLDGQELKTSNFCFRNYNMLLVTSWIWVIHISLIAGVLKNRSLWFFSSDLFLLFLTKVSQESSMFVHPLSKHTG